MKRLVVMVLALFLSFLLPSAELSAAGVNFSQLQAMLATCMKLIQVEDFRGAAMLYHYPAGYTRDELDQDIAAVTKRLQVMHEEFGGFGDVKSLQEPTLHVDIHVTGGTHGYWGRQRRAFKFEYRTEFENFGPGFLIIEVVDIIGALEIKAVTYGLPVSGESVSRIKKVGDRLIPLTQRQLDERSFPGAGILGEEES